MKGRSGEVLNAGTHTADIAQDESKAVGTAQMGEAIKELILAN